MTSLPVVQDYGPAGLIRNLSKHKNSSTCWQETKCNSDSLLQWLSALLTSGRTSRPKISISSSFGQPEMMNCVTPMRLYSRKHSARSCGDPSSVIADDP